MSRLCIINPMIVEVRNNYRRQEAHARLAAVGRCVKVQAREKAGVAARSRMALAGTTYLTATQ
jgi:hypothetical protein